jgi:hypothetical protein
MFFEYEDQLLPLSDIKSCSTDAHKMTTIVLKDGRVLKSKSFYPYKSIDEVFKLINSLNAPRPSQENIVKKGAAPSSSKLTVELELDSATAKAIARQHRKN